MTDPRDRSPPFVTEALAEAPELADLPIDRLPELLTPVELGAGAVDRLLAEVAELPLRYAPFFDRLSELWDLPEDGVRAVLARSRDAKAWRRAPLPGLTLLNVEGGPRIRGTNAYLARFAPGMRFPKHRHRGHEDVLLLEGSYTDSGGRVYQSGDVHTMSAGSEHGFVIADDEPCVAAAVHRGIEFSNLGMRLLSKLFRA